MDIENSPGAPMRHFCAMARCDWGPAGELAVGELLDFCLCSMRHPATVRGERRFIEDRTKGVLWHHSSVNLVEPRAVAPAAAWNLGVLPKIKSELASWVAHRNQRKRAN
jgi:hypothetical protein